MGKKRPEAASPPPAPDRPFHDPFAKLRERLPEGWEAPGPGPARPPGERIPARAVVRLERKGRAGKEATVVDRLALPPDALARWLDEAKRALGCGGGIEDAALVLQGDQRDRVARWLEGRGVREVTVAGGGRG
jgi:translation initiation factor 1